MIINSFLIVLLALMIVVWIKYIDMNLIMFVIKNALLIQNNQKIMNFIVKYHVLRNFHMK